MRHDAAFDDRIFRNNALGFTLDLSEAPAAPAQGIDDALAALADLEAGAVANADEGRQVGHYWLRDPERAPTAAVQDEIIESWGRVADLPVGQFRDILLIGIGGSALGPQLLAEALRSAGFAVDLDLSAAAFGKQFKRADRSGAAFAMACRWSFIGGRARLTHLNAVQARLAILEA